ncbi:MAG: type VI secretion system tube protein Hcp [Luteitalea sp.]|nr:type VI secretion system tube protein Hcp [Luteitalea sp.]
MAIADMFLKVQGVTGEAGDAEHKGEIEVVSWSWGMQASTSVATGQATGKATINELHIVKRVDQSSPTLMTYLRSNKRISQAQLTVRKAGKEPLEYFKIELENVRVTSFKAESEGPELVEHVCLGFSKVTVSYTPQDATGARGGGANVFVADVHSGS